MEMTRILPLFSRPCFVALGLLACVAHASDAPLWRTNQTGVTVDIKDCPLPKLLQQISVLTGWKVYMEKGTTATITGKFKSPSVDEAVSRLLAQVNYTRMATNGASQLLVYRTLPGAATEAIVPADPDAKKDYRIPNELIVRLKADSKESIEDLAKKLHAKIVGRDDRLRLYRLQFDDEANANAAQIMMATDPSVAQVSPNFIVDPPAPVQFNPIAATGPASPSSLLNPKTPVNGRVIGLVDTAIQMQSQFQQYAVNPVSVVGQPDPSADQITHGTSMLETMLQGMTDAPSKIQPVDVYPSGDSTTTYEVVEGIIAAVNAGDNPINLSLGGTGNSALLQQVIEEGVAKNILFVAASGNTPGTATTYPASYPGVLAVTASGANGQLASYANDGSFVQAMEPGTSIVYLNGQAWQVEGTSTATALATADIAQLMNQQHLTTAQAVAQFIQSHPPPKQ
jgi:hypothetical protein